MDLAPFEVLNPLAERAVRSKVFGLMMWPNDEDKRFSFVLSNVNDLAQQIAMDRGSQLTTDATVLRLMRERAILPPLPMMEGALQPVIRGSTKAPNAPEMLAGQVAGQILIHATHRVTEGHRNIGLNDCLDRVSADLRREGAKTAVPRDLKRHWHEFRSVAPLWASWMYAVRWWQTGMLSDPRLFLPTLLIEAERYRMMGETIIHRNASEPLLPPDSTWRLRDDTRECLLAQSERT